MPSVVHCRDRHANNRVEVLHEHERRMRRFKSAGQAQRFLAVHSQVHNLFRSRTSLHESVPLLCVPKSIV